MTKHICFFCEKGIDIVGGYRMVALEIPYCNLFFHKDCFLEVCKEFPDVYDYLQHNVNKVVRWLEKSKKT